MGNFSPTTDGEGFNSPFATELRLELLPLVSGTHSMADTVVVVQREVAWNGFFDF